MAVRFRLPAVLLGVARGDKAAAVKPGMIAAFWNVEARTKVLLPLMVSRASCGFPSPADDYIDKFLDLNEKLIRNRDATQIVECAGDSMIGVGIFPGDWCLVDKSAQAIDGDVVVAILDGEFTIKTYRRRGDRHWLQPENPAYRDIELTEGLCPEIWGVVWDSIRRHRHGRR